MTLRSLEIFVAVAQSGKMSAAANVLHIAQPTISQAIAELEREYDIRLFDRLSRKLYITPAGQQLLSYAKGILLLSAEMDKEMKNLAKNKTIRLGATITVGKCVLVDLVRQFEAAHPTIKINVTIDNTVTIEELLLSSKLDIALVEGNVHSTELISDPVIPDELVLVCHKDHPLANRTSVTLPELSSFDFLLREEGSGTRELFEERLRQGNVRVTPKWTCHGSDSILEALLANQGISVLSRRLVDAYCKAGVLCTVEIEGNEMKRSFSIVHHKSKLISDTIAALITFIRQSDVAI